VHDQSQLEAKGIPGVMVATAAFRDGVEAQARAYGFTYSAVFVEHPVQDRTDAEMVAMADGAIDAIVAQLVAAADE
jgi:hypothetical protein